jgi:hypothetical protein
MEVSRLPPSETDPSSICMVQGANRVLIDGENTLNMAGRDMVFNFAPNPQPSLWSILGRWLLERLAGPSPSLIPPSAPIPDTSSELANGHPLSPPLPPPPPAVPSGSHNSATTNYGESNGAVGIVCARMCCGDPALTT